MDDDFVVPRLLQRRANGAEFDRFGKADFDEYAPRQVETQKQAAQEQRRDADGDEQNDRSGDKAASTHEVDWLTYGRQRHIDSYAPGDTQKKTRNGMVRQALGAPAGKKCRYQATPVPANWQYALCAAMTMCRAGLGAWSGNLLSPSRPMRNEGAVAGMGTV